MLEVSYINSWCWHNTCIVDCKLGYSHKADICQGAPPCRYRQRPSEVCRHQDKTNVKYKLYVLSSKFLLQTSDLAFLDEV